MRYATTLATVTAVAAAESSITTISKPAATSSSLGPMSTFDQQHQPSLTFCEGYDALQACLKQDPSRSAICNSEFGVKYVAANGINPFDTSASSSVVTVLSTFCPSIISNAHINTATLTEFNAFETSTANNPTTTSDESKASASATSTASLINGAPAPEFGTNNKPSLPVCEAYQEFENCQSIQHDVAACIDEFREAYPPYNAYGEDKNQTEGSDAVNTLFNQLKSLCPDVLKDGGIKDTATVTFTQGAIKPVTTLKSGGVSTATESKPAAVTSLAPPSFNANTNKPSLDLCKAYTSFENCPKSADPAACQTNFGKVYPPVVAYGNNTHEIIALYDQLDALCPDVLKAGGVTDTKTVTFSTDCKPITTVPGVGVPSTIKTITRSTDKAGKPAVTVVPYAKPGDGIVSQIGDGQLQVGPVGGVRTLTTSDAAGKPVVTTVPEVTYHSTTRGGIESAVSAGVKSGAPPAFMESSKATSVPESTIVPASSSKSNSTAPKSSIVPSTGGASSLTVGATAIVGLAAMLFAL